MRLLDRLVLKDLVPQLLIGIGLFTALYIAAGPVLGASRFLASGIPWTFIVRFVLLSTVSFLGLTFPMGMLLSVLLGYGRLSGDSETVALFAGGIPFARIAAPAAVLGLLVSAVGYVVNDPIASYAAKQLVYLRQNALHQQLDTDKPFDLPETRKDGQLVATVHVEKGFSLRKREMRGVTITLYAANGQPSVVYHAAWVHPQGNDPNALTYQLDDVTGNTLGPHATYQYWPHLDSQYHDISQTAIGRVPQATGELALLKNDPNALPFGETQRALALIKRVGLGDSGDVRTIEVTLWNKIALPLASVVFALIGAALALRPQRSAKVTGWVLSLPIILVYYVLYTVMASVARGGGCSPALAAFMPDIVGLFVGLGLVWKRSVT